MKVTKPLVALAFAFAMVSPVQAESGGAEMSRDFRSGNCWYSDAAKGKCSLHQHSTPAYIYGSDNIEVKNQHDHTKEIVRDRR